MGFRQRDSEGRGGFARIWSIEDKGNYSLAKISTSRRKNDVYETDFQDGFVRLIGSAHKKAQTLNVTSKGVTIQITSCEVTTPYNPKTQKGYVNYAVFSFEIPDGNDGDSTASVKDSKKSTAKTSKTKTSKAKTKKETSADDDADDDDLPF